MTGRPLGVNTYGFIWSTPMAECVRRLRGQGFTRFEVVVNPPHLRLDDSDAAQRRRLAAELRADGITLRSLNLPSLDTNLASPMPMARAASIAMFRAAIDLAGDLGIPYLVTVPGRMNPLLAPTMAQRTDWVGESLSALVPHAEARGVNLALENVPFAAFPDAGSLGHFVRSFDSRCLSVCYDAANAHFIGESPAAGLRSLGDLVSLVHLSDTTHTVWRHDEVGQGDVPFAEIPPALDAIGFQGDCMLEIIAPRPAEAIIRSQAALAGLGFGTCRAEVAA